tara:strand:- start:432 stop:620 length:189 start_codon:yes stop_codon:yes gene_type:complete
MLSNDHTLKYLNALLLTLTDLYVNPYGIARLHYWPLYQLAPFDSFDDRVHTPAPFALSVNSS